MKEYLKAFDKVIGYDDEKRKLIPVCDMMRNPEKYKKLGVSMPHGAVLQGDPGYGKTLLSKCFIEACGVPYFICRKDKADGNFIDYLKECFDKAVSEAPAIVFLDDMDKFANEDAGHKNTEEYVAVQACMDNVKDKDVFVIATTNESRRLPDSLLRAGRFDINLEINGLDKESQIKLIDYFLKTKSFVENVSAKEIWNIIGSGISCAELEKIINDAAIKAAFDERDTVTRDDVIQSCLDHHFGGVDLSKQPGKEFLLAIAYHEAGHIVVSEALDPNSVSLASIKAYHSSNGGVTCYFEQAESPKFVSGKMNKVIRDLAGKAAIEIVFKEIDTGTYSDLYHAKILLDDIRDDIAAFGFDFLTNWGSLRDSDKAREKAEYVMKMEIKKLYEKAKTILIENRPFLDAIANLLLEKQTIFCEDIQGAKKVCGIV